MRLDTTQPNTNKAHPTKDHEKRHGCNQGATQRVPVESLTTEFVQGHPARLSSLVGGCP